MKRGVNVSRWLSVFVGTLWVLGFITLSKSSVGTRIGFLKSWTASNPGELQTWLGVIFLLTPGTTLLTWGLAPWLSVWLKACLQWLKARSRPYHMWLISSAGITALSTYGLVGSWMSRGYPLLDEIASVRFGGRILATGKVQLKVPECWPALSHLYLHARDGFYTSFDWLGAQLAWALSELTHTGSWVFAAMAAGTLVAVMLTLRKLLDVRWGVVAGLAFVCSPMAFMLSLSSHAHIGSRLFVALSIFAYVYAQTTSLRQWWLALGVCLGMGIMFRPIEVTLLLAPLLIATFIRSSNDPHTRYALGWTLAGLVVPLAVIAWHNHIVTGHFWLFARFAHNDFLEASNLRSQRPWAIFMDASLLWHRFGTNLIYNLQQLFIWALGPIGVVFFACGVSATRLSRLLSWGIALLLLLALAHDDSGLHVFGPMHYSDAIVPMIIVIVYGIRRAHHNLQTLLPASSSHLILSFCIGMLAGGLGLSLRQVKALHYQGAIHDSVYGMVWDKKFNHAVVIALPYETLWKQHWQQQLPTFVEIDSHLRYWPPSDPRFNDRVVFAHEGPGHLERLRRCFPDRRFYHLYSDPEGGVFRVEAID